MVDYEDEESIDRCERELERVWLTKRRSRVVSPTRPALLHLSGNKDSFYRAEAERERFRYRRGESIRCDQ
jgi:hypothetical protein